MKKGGIIFLWVIFIFIIPALYTLLKHFFPDNINLEIMIVYAPYFLSVFTIMYRVDIRVYFIFKRILLYFLGGDTSWLFSVRYTNILDQDKTINKLEEILIQQNCKIIKKEYSFISVLWNDTNILNFRIENAPYNKYDLLFFTSRIEVSYKSINKKIAKLSQFIECIESFINMVDRRTKQYEIQIIYPEKNPYYSYWVRTIPGEKIKSLNCKIYDSESSQIDVTMNQIRFNDNNLQSLFYKIRNYLSLRGL
jgi:hypothetical protein